MRCKTPDCLDVMTCQCEQRKADTDARAEERAAIVAWLRMVRANQDYWQLGPRAVGAIAAAIERGDHHLKRPDRGEHMKGGRQVTKWERHRALIQRHIDGLEGRGPTGDAIRAALARLDAAELVCSEAFEHDQASPDVQAALDAYDALVREQDGGR